MIRFAKMKPAGFKNKGKGIRYGRGRSGSFSCRAAAAIGANAYMIAVADVTSPMSELQLGKGRNASSPITKASRMDPTGTLRFDVLVSQSGITSSSPSAYEMRAEVPR